MAHEQQRPKAFKSSIWYVGLLVSGFFLVAGLVFTRWPASLPPLRGDIAQVINEAISEREARAQTCSCHPNKAPEKVESISTATIEIRNEETGETITVPNEFHTESYWHEGAAF